MPGWLGRCSSAFVISAVIATPAFAQHRQVPGEGMFALGVSAGAGLPTDALLKNGWFVAASGEAYLTPRIALRGQLGGAWFDVFGHPFDGRVSPMTVTGNVVYNWERGEWHPYVTAGIGIYRFRYQENSFSGSDTKAGVNFGGGVEYFLSNRDAITAEIILHAPSGRADSRFTSYQTRFWTIAGGYKFYF